MQAGTSYSRVMDLLAYTIVDSSGAPVGPVVRVWADNPDDSLKFVGIKTGWFLAQVRVIPAKDARIDTEARTIHVRYSADAIKGAPSHSSDVSLTTDQESKVYNHYDHR